MVLSRQVYISDGTTKQYPIAFADGYLSRDEVNVYEEYDDGTPDKDIPFTFINDNLIQLTTVPASGTRIVIERDVEATARKVVFIPQYIKSSDLNTMYQHLLYLIQALMDGRLESTIKSDLDMGYNKIINLGAPTNDNDAVRLVDIKTYTDLAESLNQQNAAYVAAAKVSETNAKVSETNAKASENAAKASQTAAAASAESAANTANGFDVHAAEKQQDFDDNATSKTNTFNSNASTKTTAFNDNYTTKLNAFNSNATTKTNDFNSNASEKQAQVDASAEEARKWAVGTISEQRQGSAKYWAEQVKTATAGTLNESILTNCLIEIPQDIKLELSNGTLTLKAGSKVYVPNGVGKFDIKTLSKDLQYKGYYSDTRMIVVNSNLQGLDGLSPGRMYSGNSAPKNTEYMFWYDTANNIIKLSSDTGSSWTGQYSLPICIETSSSSAITSIDQVFNGFGYIGNTIFALPGIKGRVPNDFSTDGKPNSTEFTTTSVLTYSYINANSGVLIGINANSLASDKYVYNKDENYNRNSQGVIAPRAMFAKVSTDSTGRVTSFNPNTAFHAVDYSEYAREVDRCAKIDEDNAFTGNCTFSIGKAHFKADAGSAEGGEFKIEIPNSLKEVLGDEWSFDVYSTGDIRLFRTGGSQSMTQFTFAAKSGVINYRENRTLALSDNSGNVPDTKWINSKFQKASTLPAQPDPDVTYLIPEE